MQLRQTFAHPTLTPASLQRLVILLTFFESHSQSFVVPSLSVNLNWLTLSQHLPQDLAQIAFTKFFAHCLIFIFSFLRKLHFFFFWPTLNLLFVSSPQQLPQTTLQLSFTVGFLQNFCLRFGELLTHRQLCFLLPLNLNLGISLQIDFGATGERNGAEDGDEVGGAVGCAVGDELGATVGCAVGDAVGATVGCDDGDEVGATVGCDVGDEVGGAVICDVGDEVGGAVICDVGDEVGATVGCGKLKSMTHVSGSIVIGSPPVLRTSNNFAEISTFATSITLLISQLAPAHIGKFDELTTALEHAFSKFRTWCCPPRSKHSVIVSGKLQSAVSAAPKPRVQSVVRAMRSANRVAGLPRSPNAAVSFKH